MKLLIQPGDGVERLLKGIRKAKKSIELMIFRFDRPEIERALADAVERGVFVHALIAFTNRGGEANLRKLEKRFLADGITVARTAGDLVRYHGKMIVVDRKELYLLAFNFTYLDIDHTRSFALITRNPTLVAEGVKLFEADTKRQVYSAGSSKFLVSPVNARNELTRFIKGAKKELLIYDPNISDRAMLRLLVERKESGVKVRIIGKVAGKSFQACELKRMRLHTRTIVRDRKDAFVGSQSLRQVELDTRREIGLIFRDSSIVKDLVRTFEEDWETSASDDFKKEERREENRKEAARSRTVVKRVAKSVAKKIKITPVAKRVAKAIGKNADGDLNGHKLQKKVEEIVEDVVEATAKDAAKEAVKAVSDAG
jgi:cardiolipin synthase A/B